MLFSPDEYRKIREALYERLFGSIDEVFHSTVLRPVHIDIYRFAPTPARPFWTLQDELLKLFERWQAEAKKARAQDHARVSCVLAGWEITLPAELQETADGGGITLRWTSTSRYRTGSSMNWGCPGSPRDLNQNRPVRTRRPGGVAGVVEVIPPRSYADSRVPIIREIEPDREWRY